MCSDGWYNGKANGECEECGGPTVDGEAQAGCYWASVACEECGAAPCDEGC